MYSRSVHTFQTDASGIYMYVSMPPYKHMLVHMDKIVGNPLMKEK